MIEKYEDLLQNMKEDFLIHEHEASAVKAALQWLDENPDQAPGRTITESAFREACEKYAAACAIQHNAEPARSRADFYRFMARIKADALREAAEQASAPVNRHQWPTPESVADFLRRRADRVEEDA